MTGGDGEALARCVGDNRGLERGAFLLAGLQRVVLLLLRRTRKGRLDTLNKEGVEQSGLPRPLFLRPAFFRVPEVGGAQGAQDGNNCVKGSFGDIGRNAKHQPDAASRDIRVSRISG